MPKALIVGASRGIGLGLVGEFAARGWEVVGTARATGGEALNAKAADSGGKIQVETVDIADAASTEALAGRLQGQVFDLVLVNAGIGGPLSKNTRNVTDAEYNQLMITNGLAPVRAAEHLVRLAKPETGVVAFMTSLLGSVEGAGQGGFELYRASKAALNSMTRSFAAAHKKRGLTVLSLHPGWVKTDMGGEAAPVEVADSVAGLTNVVERAIKDRQDGYFDFEGKPIAW